MPSAIANSNLTSIWPVTDDVPQVLKNTGDGYRANQAAPTSSLNLSQSAKSQPKTSRTSREECFITSPICCL